MVNRETGVADHRQRVMADTVQPVLFEVSEQPSRLRYRVVAEEKQHLAGGSGCASIAGDRRARTALAQGAEAAAPRLLAQPVAGAVARPVVNDDQLRPPGANWPSIAATTRCRSRRRLWVGMTTLADG